MENRKEMHERCYVHTVLDTLSTYTHICREREREDVCNIAPQIFPCLRFFNLERWGRAQCLTAEAAESMTGLFLHGICMERSFSPGLFLQLQVPAGRSLRALQQAPHPCGALLQNTSSYQIAMNRCRNQCKANHHSS